MQRDFVTEEHAVFLVKVDETVYPLAAILKTAYWFTNKCYLHVQRAEQKTIEIRFKAKKDGPQNNLGEEFMNQLLDQTLRDQISADTESLRNIIVAHALSKTCLIAPELETVPISEDPLKIAIPDEHKSP